MTSHWAIVALFLLSLVVGCASRETQWTDSADLSCRLMVKDNVIFEIRNTNEYPVVLYGYDECLPNMRLKFEPPCIGAYRVAGHKLTTVVLAPYTTNSYDLSKAYGLVKLEDIRSPISMRVVIGCNTQDFYMVDPMPSFTNVGSHVFMIRSDSSNLLRCVTAKTMSNHVVIDDALARRFKWYDDRRVIDLVILDNKLSDKHDSSEMGVSTGQAEKAENSR